MGLARYYRYFVKKFAAIAALLMQLLQKDSFVWTLVSNMAFKELKVALSNPPLLALSDFIKSFIVEIDASGTGIGAVLNQGKQLITFF